jgi:hypothetical protein
MTRLVRSSLVLCILLSASCSDVEHDKAYRDYAEHCLQAQHDYYSTNVLVAEEGLLRFRQWIINSERAGEPWFNRDLNLVGTDGRLYSLYEFQGKTNRAELFYQEAAHTYTKFLQSRGRPTHTLTKEELRERTAGQERGLSVGWKKDNTAWSGAGKAPVPKPQ